MDRKKLVCTQCGSERIQFKLWVEVNTGKVEDIENADAEDNEVYCPDCDQYTYPEDFDGYIDTCILILYRYAETKPETLRKMLTTKLGPVSAEHPTEEMIDALDNDSACDIRRRMEFLEILDLAYQQHLDSVKTEPTECIVGVKNKRQTYIMFNERNPKTPLAHTIPNRSCRYKNIQEFRNEIMNAGKSFEITSFIMLRDDELPF